MAGKKPNPVDQHVGSRVRLRRMLLGMSQERLGESMGLTFQQVQKYEKGVNRIGASRLFQISKIMKQQATENRNIASLTGFSLNDNSAPE